MDASTPSAGAYRFSGFTLDLARGALLGADGVAIPLRPKSFALLRLLVEQAGRLLERDTIMAAVWPDVVVGDESITQCVRDIRKALGDEAQALLQTVPKRGYLLAAEATALAPPPSATALPRLERRLAAIMAADIVGYSRLIEADEAATLAALKGLRQEAIDPLLAEHKGRIVKLMGDGALVEFGSVVDAVACAVAVQHGVAEQQAGVVPERRIVFRIGINLGDVVVEGEDLLGDGVNIAARLEQLCEPGGVLISGTAFDHLQGRLGLPIEDAGEQQVKNIARPVRAYRVRLEGSAKGWRPPRTAGRPSHRWPLTAAAVLFAVLFLGGIWHFWPTEPPPGKPAIAVLPLVNLSGDPRWERFADGITEDLITDLARDPDLRVIARNSTFVYKGKATDVRQVGKELGVRYVLEGSLQAETGRVRVTAQLIDASTGGHVWAERYDRPETDLFAIQDEVAQKVASALGGWYGRVNDARREEARRRPPASLDAYDLYLLGMERKHEYSKEGLNDAIRLFSRAVALDPGFAQGWTMLGVAYSIAATSGFVDDPAATNRMLVEAIKKAAALDPFDAFTQANLGGVRALEGDLKGAEAALDQALALGPNDANALLAVAWQLPLIVGRADEAVRYGQRAMALDPASPTVYAPALAVAQYAAGQYEEAITTLRQAPLDGGEMLMYWAMAQAQLGHAEEARKAAERIRTEFPSFTVEGYIRDFPVIAPAAQAALREGARKAGLLPIATQ
ncbi:MAG: winged helix-turn-helix domain-containing protein [Geminicoccaceae bacterium]